MLESLEERLRILSREIRSGSCLLALGPGASIDSREGQEVPLSVRLANKLAKEIEANHRASEIGDLNPDDLRHVAQLTLELELRSDLQLLQDRVCGFYQEFSGKTTDFHRRIASLPFKLCITTTPDDFLYNAFVAEGKTPARAFYDFRRGQAQMLREPTVARPLVYHLYGYSDNPDSLVITENDLIDFLVNVVREEPRLPSLITSQLTRTDSSCLFVDLGFKNWYLRVLLRALGLPGKKTTKSVALEEPEFFNQSKQHQTTVYFSPSSTIQFRPDSLKSFVTGLCAAYKTLMEKIPQQPVPEPPAGAPRVFLSYSSENREFVDQLGEKLKNEGIRVWQDHQNLRAGDDWRVKIIRHVIEKQTDYVVVVQTPEMTGRFRGVYYEEIKAALACQNQFGSGINFVIPARTGSVAVLPELKHLHSIAVDTDEGVKELARSILEDWAARSRRQVDRSAAASKA